VSTSAVLRSRARRRASTRGGAAMVLGEALAVLVAVLVFAVFLALVGAEPWAVLGDMVEGAFGSTFSLQNSLVRAAPLMLTALCTLLPARIGMVVIGNEGALLAGGLGAAASATLLAPHASAPWVLLTALVAGALSGALLIAFVGALRVYRGVNETISSLLVFYIALALFLYLVEGPLRDPASLNKPSTLPIAEAHMLGSLPGLDVHGGLALGILCCLVASGWASPFTSARPTCSPRRRSSRASSSAPSATTRACVRPFASTVCFSSACCWCP
jgi:general nucleoside transport system permease protein